MPPHFFMEGGKLPRYRCHLSCILLKMLAISLRTDGGAVQDNPSRHDYNLDEVMDSFIASAVGLQNKTKLNHQMWPCGSDFQYQNADHW